MSIRGGNQPILTQMGRKSSSDQEKEKILVVALSLGKGN